MHIIANIVNSYLVIVILNFVYLIVVIVFLAGNSPSSVKYTTYRKKSLGNEN